MPAAKFSISLSKELQQVLDALTAERGEERSRLIETLLRENPLVRDAIARSRLPPATKRGRSLEKIEALGRVAEAQWRQRVASGRVKYLGPVA